MNIKNKLKGIEFKTSIFILIFNISIILIVWLSETLIFNLLYRNYQINRLNSVVNKLENTKEDTYILILCKMVVF